MFETPQSEPIWVLYVDDDPQDRQLVVDSLADAAAFRVVEVGTRKDFSTPRGRPHVDVVLTDFNVLGHDGPLVLSAVREVMPNAPVIIVTGAGSEETALEAMRQGAADYVLKDPSHIRRLPLAIRAVLEQSRLRSEREAAQWELNRFCELSRDLCCVIDPSGRILRANPAAQEILGYEPDEFERQLPLQFVHAEERATVMHQLAGLAAHDRVVKFTLRCQTKSEATRWLEWSVIRSPTCENSIAVARDITERMATEGVPRDTAIAQVRFYALSPREQDVLKLVSEGQANKAIALKLTLSEKTVERHRSRGMKKLNLANVPDLVRFMMLANV
jgi:PAS domain S-box-containing protein